MTLGKTTSMVLTKTDLQHVEFLRQILQQTAGDCRPWSMSDVIRQALREAVDKRGGMPASAATAPASEVASSAAASSAAAASASSSNFWNTPRLSSATSGMAIPADVVGYRCGVCGERFRCNQRVAAKCPACVSAAETSPAPTSSSSSELRLVQATTAAPSPVSAAAPTEPAVSQVQAKSEAKPVKYRCGTCDARFFAPAGDEPECPQCLQREEDSR
jgi:DNA-directed RNA polymerase subunit RPC12/RpoP